MSGKKYKQSRKQAAVNRLSQAYIDIAEKNKLMLSHLITVAINPQSEQAIKILEFYKERYNELKQEAIHTDSNSTGAAADVQQAEG